MTVSNPRDLTTGNFSQQPVAGFVSCAKSYPYCSSACTGYAVLASECLCEIDRAAISKATSK
jgi:hypothetical protein